MAEERVEIARELVRAIAERDHETVSDLCVSGMPIYSRQTEYSLDDYIESAESNADKFELVDVEYDEVISSEDRITVFTTYTFRLHGEFMGATTDETYTTQAAQILEFDGDQVARIRTLENREDMLAKLGFLSGPMTGGKMKSDLKSDKIRLEYQEVLMRILRHNVRNRMTIAMGIASTLAASEENAAMGEQLEGVAEELTRIAEKTHRVRQELLERPLSPEPTDVEETVGAAVGDFAEEADWSVDGPADDPIRITTDPHLLYSALEEIFENAVRHTSKSTPTVTVDLDRSEDGGDVAITVTDDGPGIPDHELEAVEQEEETDLTHASGVGLWRVKWCVERLDGEVTYETPESGGTRVRIRLPELEVPEE